MFLSEDEVQDLTGYKRPADQRRWLDRNGIGYLVSARGRPVVLKSELERALGAATKATGTEPDWRHLP